MHGRSSLDPLLLCSHTEVCQLGVWKALGRLQQYFHHAAKNVHNKALLSCWGKESSKHLLLLVFSAVRSTGAGGTTVIGQTSYRYLHLNWMKEIESGRDWKGPLDNVQSDPAAKAGLLTAACLGSQCAGEFGISPKKEEIPQPI